MQLVFERKVMKLFCGEISQEGVFIHEEEQQHIIKVLRMREGEKVFVTNGKGSLARGILVLKGKKALLDVLETREDLPDFSPKLHIVIAPTKNIDRTQFFVEKATEMGVCEITFLSTNKSERKNINVEKIRKQAIAASKQSLRFHFPIINCLTKFSDFVENIQVEQTFIAHCNKTFDRVKLKQVNPKGALTFLIGPEGDFSPKEIQSLTERGVKAVSLGNQRLRTETAGVFIAAWNYMNMVDKLIVNNLFCG